MHQGKPVAVTSEVTPGREAEFEEWAHGVEAAAAAPPGQREVTWLRPEGGSRRYRAVVRFADTAGGSPTRRASSSGWSRPRGPHGRNV